MKKIILVFITASSLLLSCTKTDLPDCGCDEQGGMVAVEFGSVMTRSFFDGDPQGEVWERKIHNGGFQVYDREIGVPLMVRELTQGEIDAGRITMVIRDIIPGKEYSIMLWANCAISESRAGSMIFHEQTPHVRDYNGVYEEMLSEELYPKGFVMTAQAALSTANTQANPCRLSLERVMSKTELRTTVSDELYRTYPLGELSIESVKIENIADRAYIFVAENYPAPASPTTVVQIPYEHIPGGEYRNMFHIYDGQMESGSGDQKPTVIISARFYSFGKAAMPDNYHDVHYTFTPTWNGKTLPERNHYYRFDAKITSLTGVEIDYGTTITEQPLKFEGFYAIDELIYGHIDAGLARDLPNLTCYLTVAGTHYCMPNINGEWAGSFGQPYPIPLDADGKADYTLYLENAGGFTDGEELIYTITLTDNAGYEYKQTFRRVCLNRLKLLWHYADDVLTYTGADFTETPDDYEGFLHGIVIWFRGGGLPIELKDPQSGTVRRWFSGMPSTIDDGVYHPFFRDFTLYSNFKFME